MAISRERLEELIEQGATIYVVNNKVVFEEKLNKHYTHDVLKDCVCWWGIPRKRWFFKDIFETKAEAEWVVKMHTARTEYFEPPTWEEFEKEHKPYRFISKSGLRETIYIFDKNIHNKLLSSGSRLFGKPTKENYIKAVEYARKLFEGEKL